MRSVNVLMIKKTSELPWVTNWRSRALCYCRHYGFSQFILIIGKLHYDTFYWMTHVILIIWNMIYLYMFSGHLAWEVIQGSHSMAFCVLYPLPAGPWLVNALQRSSVVSALLGFVAPPVLMMSEQDLVEMVQIAVGDLNQEEPPGKMLPCPPHFSTTWHH